jgi:hypothetical protein
VPAQKVDDRDPGALRRFAVDLMDETDALALRHLAAGLTDLVDGAVLGLLRGS